MQGRKQFADEKALCFTLSAHVPAHNFYRRLKQQLNLNFLNKLTTLIMAGVASRVLIRWCSSSFAWWTIWKTLSPTANSSNIVACGWT